jgi:biopolymer transport protein ExbD
MKFPRNAKILRSPFEMAPFAAMFFLLVIFMLLAALLPVPGIPLQLPVVNDLPGIDRPTVAMAVDSGGRFFFASQLVGEVQLGSDLRDAARKSRVPLTLVIHADKSVTEEQLIHLALLAGTNGIQSALLATLPGVAGASARP